MSIAGPRGALDDDLSHESRDHLHGLRILMTADTIGGVWTYALDLAGALGAAGAVVRIATLGPGPRPDQRAEVRRRGLDVVETGYALDWLAQGPDAVRAAAAGVALLARRFGADVAHLNAPALAAAARFPCPVVTVNHSCVATWWARVHGTPLPPRYAWGSALTGEGLKAADLAIVPTAAFGALVQAAHGLARAPRAVHNGREVPALSPPVRTIDEVFTAGRLWDEGKNVAALDRAAGRLPYPARAAGETAKPGGGAIRFAALDAVGVWSGERMRHHLASRPVFVAPTRYEPFGLAILEAAQAGCALVLNDIASLRELWDGAALFVDADDVALLAGTIRGVFEDPDTRRALGAAARAHAATYSVEAMAAGMASAYRACRARARVPETAALGV